MMYRINVKMVMENYLLIFKKNENIYYFVKNIVFLTNLLQICNFYNINVSY